MIGINKNIQQIINNFNENNFDDIYKGLKDSFYKSNNLNPENKNHKKYNKKFKENILKKLIILF